MRDLAGKSADKLVGRLTIDTSQLAKQVEEANKLLKKIGADINLDLTDVMKKRIDAMLKSFAKSANEAGLAGGKTSKSGKTQETDYQKKNLEFLRGQVTLRKQLSDIESAGAKATTQSTKDKAQAMAEYTRNQIRDLDELSNGFKDNEDAMKIINKMKVDDVKIDAQRESVAERHNARTQRRLELEAKEGALASTRVLQTSAWGRALTTVYDSFTRIAKLAAFRMFNKLWQDATRYAREYHDALNEIRIVTGMSEQDAHRLGEEYLS